MFTILSCMLLIFYSCLHNTEAIALEIMLPKVYDEHMDIVGWLASEKLDGVRGYWDGKKLISKNGKPFYPPIAFTHNFPAFALEGEIWAGREGFEQTISVVKKKEPHNGWLALKFAIFDVPATDGVFTQRLNKAKKWFSQNHSDYAFIIPQMRVTSRNELQKELRRVEKLGGEGLIVRKPDALYSKGRSIDILKVKSYYDMEAVVIAYVPGKGKNLGKMGSLLMELPNGTQFKIGTGFSDEKRANPPQVGANITFKYYGFYQSGIPKFPSFLRIRE